MTKNRDLTAAKMRRLLVSLKPADYDWITDEARAQGESRSAILRALVRAAREAA